jgi:hypothetical protein
VLNKLLLFLFLIPRKLRRKVGSQSLQIIGSLSAVLNGFVV